MVMRMRSLRFWIGMAVPIFLLCGCGSGSESAKTAGSQAGAAESDDPRAPGIMQPCGLLTAEQVSTVLPGHDAGTPKLSGGSLMKGIEAYQCSYSNKSMDMMTVVLNIANDDESFSWINPGEGLHRNHRKIEIGDRGWAYGEDNNLKIEVVKGRAIINLELISPGARSKSDALIELARIVAGRVQ